MRILGVTVYTYSEFNDMVNEHVLSASNNYNFLTFSGVRNGDSQFIEGVEIQTLTSTIQSWIDNVEAGHLDNTRNLAFYLFYKEVIPVSHVLISP